MHPSFEFNVAQVSWQEAGAVLRHIRTIVFIQEQNVPPELEWDDGDVHCVHVLARLEQGGQAIGTGRLLPDGRLGRMAVLPGWRGRGVGSAILETLLEIARHQYLSFVVLHAQTHAVGFYQRFGFAITGDEFIEAGIPHRAMRLLL
jgi:predicted GNAT family N-acyltransferase